MIGNLITEIISPMYRQTEWRTLRLFAHTLGYLGSLASQEGMNVPQFLDHMIDYIEELKKEIEELEREINQLEQELSNCENKEKIALWNT